MTVSSAAAWPPYSFWVNEHSFHVIHSFMWYNFTFQQTSSTGIWKNPTYWSQKNYKTLRVPLHIHPSLLVEPTDLQNNARQIGSFPQHFAVKINNIECKKINQLYIAIVKSLSLDSRISPPLFFSSFSLDSTVFPPCCYILVAQPHWSCCPWSQEEASELILGRQIFGFKRVWITISSEQKE